MAINHDNGGGEAGVSNLRDTYTTLPPVGAGGYTLDTTDDVVIPVDSSAGEITIKLDSTNAVVNQRVRVEDIFPNAATNPIFITNTADTVIGRIDTDDGSIEFTWTGASWQLSDKVENNFDRDPVTKEISPAKEGDAIVAQKVRIVHGGDGFVIENQEGKTVASIDTNGKISGRSGEYGLLGDTIERVVSQMTNIGANVDQSVSGVLSNVAGETTNNTFRANLATGVAGSFDTSSLAIFDSAPALVNGTGKVNVAHAVDGGAFSTLVDMETFKALANISYTSQFDLEFQLVGTQTFSKAELSSPDGDTMQILSDGSVICPSGKFGKAGALSTMDTFTNIGANVDVSVAGEYGNDVSSGADATFLLTFDGPDESTVITDLVEGRSFVANGGAKLDTSYKKFGKASLYLDGVDSSVSTVTDDDLDLGNNSFILEAVVRPIVASASYRIMSKYKNGDKSFLLDMSGGNLRFYASSNGITDDGTMTMVAAHGMSNNTASHVLVNRDGNDFYMFVDGVLIATATSSNTIYKSNTDLLIGAIDVGTSFFAGHIDELRFFVGGFAYTSGFTPPVSTYAQYATTNNTLDANLANGTSGTFSAGTLKIYDENDAEINDTGKMNVARDIDGNGFSTLVDLQTSKGLGDLTYTSQFDLQFQAVGAQRWKYATISTPNNIIEIQNDGAVVLKASNVTYAKLGPNGFQKPSFTTAERDAISTPSLGQEIYNSSTGQMNHWNGSAWTADLKTIVAGKNIGIDNTDPQNPIVNSLSDRYKTSSVTSNTIASTGALTFTVDLDLSYTVNQDVIISYDSSNYMNGTVTSYDSATGVLIVDVQHKHGSGTYTSWVINLDGIHSEENLVASTLVGEPTGSDVIVNAVSLTQAEYDAGTPVATTLYHIIG